MQLFLFTPLSAYGGKSSGISRSKCLFFCIITHVGLLDGYRKQEQRLLPLMAENYLVNWTCNNHGTLPIFQDAVRMPLVMLSRRRPGRARTQPGTAPPVSDHRVRGTLVRVGAFVTQLDCRICFSKDPEAEQRTRSCENRRRGFITCQLSEHCKAIPNEYHGAIPQSSQSSSGNMAMLDPA